MKTIMKKLITIKSIPVLALVLLVVLVSSFVKGTAQDLEPDSVYLADDTVTDSIVKKLQGTITLYVTEEEVDVEADIAAINELYDLYCLFADAGDLEGWLELWDDNAIRMDTETPAVFGKEQIRAQMTFPFENFNTNCVIYGETEVQVAGDWAFSRGTYTLTIAPKEGGPTTYIDGKWLDILKRQADGSWKIYWDIFNSNVPPPVE